MIPIYRSISITNRERKADRLLVAADPEFARSLGVVVPSPLPSSAAKAFATLVMSIGTNVSEAEEAFAAVGRVLGPPLNSPLANALAAIESSAAGPRRLPRRGNLSIPPPGIAVPPVSRFG